MEPPRSRPEDGPFLYALLAVAGLLHAPLRLLGVDVHRFREILEWKLRLDLRRGARRGSGSFEVGAARKTGLLVTGALYAFVGLFLGWMAQAVDDSFLAVALVQAMCFFMVGLALVGDFTSVLLDPTDLSALGPLPVDDRTILAARLAHVGLYVFVLVTSLSAGVVLFGGASFGLAFAFSYFPAALLASCDAAFGAVLLYLVAVRIFRPARIRNAILWCQIGATVLMVAVYQIIPRVLDVTEMRLDAWVGRHPAILFLFPPFHAAGLVEVCRGNATTLNLLLALYAVVVPGLLVYLTLRLGARGFLASIAALDEDGPAPARRGLWRVFWRRILTHSGPERAGFDFYSGCASRDRQFRLRTYPMFGILLVLCAMPLLRTGEADSLVLALYYFAMFAPAAMAHARFTETPDAAWLFRAVPFARGAEFLRGTRRAHFACFLLPVLGLLVILVLAVGGVHLFPHALYASQAAVATTVLGATLFRGIPFTRAFEPVEAMSGCTTYIVFAGALFVVGGIHMAVRYSTTATYVAAAALLTANAIALHHLGRRPPRPFD